MTKQDSVARHKVPMSQKIAFGIGMFANQMFPAILGIFMVILVENSWLLRIDVGLDLFGSSDI